MFSPTVIEIFHSANKVTLTRRKCIEQCTFLLIRKKSSNIIVQDLSLVSQHLCVRVETLKIEELVGYSTYYHHCKAHLANGKLKYQISTTGDN
jgi:hypothetical protein